MSDANNNRVHLMYLPLLADLQDVRSYSWGSAVLAMLYYELCRTTKFDAVDIGGCLILLQLWTLYRMSFLASVRHQAYVFPLVNRDLVLRQFGCIQYIPVLPMQLGRIHRINKRGKHGNNWGPVPDIEAKPEPKLELEPEPEQLHTHFADSSYHPKLRVNDYFPSSSGHGYHSGFDIFSPVPPQYNTPPGLYPPHYSTPLGLYLP
ncbi:hypothetical protein PVK06_026450 [Gossypium arboreum]|uniref:Aminotransferase-like plant mobile domain-containing protein n=1 Tax=Gossypium arboreum TaxID=29729 RepID=A0ABR0NY17_GOSAR|nr:hypothetical protein PVK06_026450 [Gossypium arboreum]